NCLRQRQNYPPPSIASSIPTNSSTSGKETAKTTIYTTPPKKKTKVPSQKPSSPPTSPPKPQSPSVTSIQKDLSSPTQAPITRSTCPGSSITTPPAGWKNPST